MRLRHLKLTLNSACTLQTAWQQLQQALYTVAIAGKKQFEKDRIVSIEMMLPGD
jgi:hypothetical protein